MTAKAALCRALLSGNVLNVKNCFDWIGLSNCAREVSRMVEQPFGVTVTRTKYEGMSRYGKAITWYNYQLFPTNENLVGMRKMADYIREHEK